MNSPLDPAKVRIATFLPLLLLFSACSKIISDEFPDYETIPAVSSIVVAGKPITFQVSLVEKIDTTFLTLINDAELLLSDTEGQNEAMTPQGDGIYTSDMIAMPGAGYMCNIKIDGYDGMNAFDKVPEITEVIITGQTNQARFDEEGIFMEGIEFEFRDNPSTRDYYEVALYRKEHGYKGNTYPFNENSDILLNEGLEPYSTETLIFSDQLMKDSMMTMNLDYSPSGWSSSCWGPDSCVQNIDEHTLILEFRHVSQEYYQYKKHFYLYEKNRYPFFVEGTATAFSLYSNIENGMGIMAGYAYSIDSIFVEEEHIPMK